MRPFAMRPFDLPRRARASAAIAALALALALAGCQTAPAGSPTAAQVEVLKQQGFELTANGWELGLSERVLFNHDEDVVSSERMQAVQRLRHALVAAGIGRLRLDGHTDNAGAAEHNQQLSLRRAQAVAKVLESAGFPRLDMQVRGLGDSRPVADNRSPEGRAQNRRVSIIVTVE